MDKIKLIVDRKLGLKNEHYEVEYPASDIGALRNYVSWVMKDTVFCDDCKFLNSESCSIAAFSDILNRIRNLRGETHDC